MTHEESSSPLEELAEEIADDLEKIERRSPLARTLVTVAIAVVLAAVVIGVVLLVSVLMRDTETARSQVDATDMPQLVLRSTEADITVVEGDGDQVEVTAEVTSGLFGTDYELRRTDDGLEIASGCLAVLNPGCGVAVEVAVPAQMPVEIATGSGDVVADALTDRVVTIGTGSGDVVAEDLQVDELSATTRSGAVTASFARAPYAVKAITGSGAVDLVLPAGERGYRMDVQSSSGEVGDDIASQEDASAFVRVRSDSGDVTVTER